MILPMAPGDDDIPSRLPGNWYQRKLLDEFARRQNLLGEALSQRPPPPVLGDILSLPPTAARWLGWVVVSRRAETNHYLVVPADTSPLTGSTDLVISRRALCGPLVLRLGARRWWPKRLLGDGERIGFLEDWHLDRAQSMLMQLLKGSLAVMPWQQQTDLDPDYQAWLETVEKVASSVELRWDRSPR